ncbi:MAG TPA: EutN/CcmL family microcompartment protein [Actinobacteria bacterium]|jgi:carbon dioxide concentrating mechanism protein CcmL|nr:EutN/CcmL family microcompartment protein [Actinomycetota bacterium]
MIIGRVIGTVVSNAKEPKYEGYKLLVVKEMNVYGEYEKNFHIAADLIGAGIDEVVMLVNGAAARGSVETNEKGIDAVITAKIAKAFIRDKEIIY